MEKEKVSEKTILDYESYSSIKNMFTSGSETDIVLASEILKVTDQKKSLPFILLILTDLRRYEKHKGKSIIYEHLLDKVSIVNKIYNAYLSSDKAKQIKSLFGFSSFIDYKTTEYPFNSTDAGDLFFFDSTKQFKTRSRSLYPPLRTFYEAMNNINYKMILDSIVIQSDYSKYYCLESDLERFILTTEGYFIQYPGVTINYNLQKAIEKRKIEIDESRGIK